MDLEVLRWALRSERRSLLVWAGALATIVAIYVPFYTLMGDTGELQRLTDTLPEGLVAALGYDRIGTAAGYLESTVFGLLAPVLMLVHGIGAGARLIAGDEEAGLLELEMTAPVPRRGLLLARMTALFVSTLALGIAVVVTTLVFVIVLDLDVAAGNVIATGVGLVLLVFALSAVAFAAGAATGRRAIALGAGTGLAVAAFVSDALLALVDVPSWALHVSPFAWYLGGDPLVQGLDPGGALALVVLGAVAKLVAVAAYERRDLGV